MKSRQTVPYPRYLFVLLLTIFAIKGVAVIVAHGARPLVHAAGDIEEYIRDSATIFVEQGWLSSSGLPIYPTYEIHSSIAKLKENHVYAHQFAGPDYILGVFYQIFGVSTTTFQWARLFPLFTLLAAFVLFAKRWNKVDGFRWAWSLSFLAASVLFVPALMPWSLQLASESYGSSCLLLILAWSTVKRKTPSHYGIGVLLGFLSLYMYLPLCFISVSIPLCATLIQGKPISRNSLTLSFCLGLGMILAFSFRLVQVAHYLGSFSDAVQSQIDIGKYRVLGNDPGVLPTWIESIGRYSLHVRGFFRFGALAMLVTGGFGALLVRGTTSERLRIAGSLLVASLACYMWVILVRGYSMAHTHFHPRSFLLLYLMWLLVWVRVATSRFEPVVRG